MTIGELQERLYQVFGVLFDLADIVRVYNTVLADLHNENLVYLYLSEQTYNVNSGEDTLELPSDFYSPFRVFYRLPNGTVFELVQVSPRVSSSGFGIPRFFAVKGSQMVIYPRPSVSGTLTLMYFPTMTPLPLSETSISTETELMKHFPFLVEAGMKFFIATDMMHDAVQIFAAEYTRAKQNALTVQNRLLGGDTLTLKPMGAPPTQEGRQR